jgi:hypothetical protein
VKQEPMVMMCNEMAKPTYGSLAFAAPKNLAIFFQNMGEKS